MSADKFVGANCDIVGLVENEAHVVKFKDATEVKTCANELRALAASSQLGKRVYGGMLSALAEKDSMFAVDEIINKSWMDQDITKKKFATSFDECADVARIWQIDQRNTQRREAEIWYRSLLLLAVVGHSIEIINSKIQSVVKSVGVRNEALEALWFELDIMPLTDGNTPPSVQPGFLTEAQNMKELINAEALITDPATGDLAVQMINNKMPQLAAIDSSATASLPWLALWRAGRGQTGWRGTCCRCCHLKIFPWSWPKALRRWRSS